MLIDTTDLEIELSIERRINEDATEDFAMDSTQGTPAKLSIDLDICDDGPNDDRMCVWFMFFAVGEPMFRLTIEEAQRVRDRLNLVLGCISEKQSAPQ